MMAEQTVLVVLGLLLSVTVLWPQPSYIFPDEFFQSTEVVAGDIFNVSHLRTWEFHPDMPLRDITMPYLLFAPGFYLLRALLNNSYSSHYIVESYAVLVIPRVVMALAGIVNLCLVRTLCQLFAVNQGTAVWFWMTSYVTWTFLTRSFSNTTESLLFSLVNILLFQASQCCRNLEPRNVTSKTMEKESQSVGRQSSRVKLYSFLMGIVLCMGFFNRPAFGFFVFVPLLWWADQLSSVRKKMLMLISISLMFTGFLLMFAIMSLSNSFYYNSEFGHLLKDLYSAVLQCDVDAIIQSVWSVVGGLKIPPWSFIQYNMVSKNLAEHGLHPWYTHLVVYMPMLLGPLVCLFYWDLLVLITHFKQRLCTDVLYAMVIIPVISLSFIPHQEARFLLPVLPVAVVCVAKNSLATWKSVKVVMMVFNIMGLVMFGWLHQGGVVPALSALQGRLKRESALPPNHGTHYHVISYATYMPPRHILFTNPSSVQVHVHDMIEAHNHPPTLQSRVEKLQSSCVKDSVVCHFWLLLPAPAVGDIRSMQGWKVDEEGEFCPHVSMERLPSGGMQSWDDVYGLMSQLCLKILSVTL